MIVFSCLFVFLHSCSVFLCRSSAESGRTTSWTPHAHTPYLVDDTISGLMEKRPKLSHHSSIDLMSGEKCHGFVLMISQSSGGGLLTKDGRSFPEEGRLPIPLVLRCRWRFADNQRTMRLLCAADTKSVAITFTFTLH